MAFLPNLAGDFFETVTHLLEVRTQSYTWLFGFSYEKAEKRGGKIEYWRSSRWPVIDSGVGGPFRKSYTTRFASRSVPGASEGGCGRSKETLLL